ncbi:hypothetical protein AKO1_015690 [Acrasis kona]|uniref:USP domain-containing protein n=1 Tax=Acrasis kona TaxID=1008807 RepID=A0AAW2ZGX4_9EUKA
MLDYITAKNEVNAEGKHIGRVREDEYQDIQLVIRDADSVEKAIDNYIKPEEMTGTEQWSCEELNKKVDAIKGLKFKTLPYLLMLHLKRFDYDPETWNRIKLGNKVSFPFELDLSKYVDTTQDDDQHPYKYELFSVLIHSGNSNGGHYYVYIKRFDDGKWYNLNDQNVTEITQDEVKQMYGGDDNDPLKAKFRAMGGSTNAYMLVYRRIHPDNKTTVSDDLIDQELKDEIELENEEYKKEQQKREQLLQMIYLKCTCFDNTFNIHINRKNTIRDACQQVLDIIKDQYMDVEKYGINDCRMRDFNPVKNQPGREFHMDTIIEELSLPQHKMIYMDLKDPNQEFQPIVEKMHVWLFKFDHNNPDEEIRYEKLHINVKSNFGELQHQINQIYKDALPVQHLGVLKYINYNMGETISLNQMHASTPIESEIKENDILCVEYLDDPSIDISRAKQYLQDKAHRVIVHYNKPNSDQYLEQAQVDDREPLSSLRNVIADQLQLHPNEFRICEKRFKKPIRDDQQTISKVNELMNHMQVHIELGDALQLGQYLIKIYLYHPSARFENHDSNDLNAMVTAAPKVSNSDNLKVLYGRQKEFIELGKVIFHQDEKLSEFKSRLELLFKDATLPDGITLKSELMRLRVKNAIMMTSTLHQSDESMKVNLNNFLVDDRQLAIQVLNQPEVLTDKDRIVYLYRWHPSTWTFGPRCELIINKDKIHTSFDLKRLICNQIPEMFPGCEHPDKDIGFSVAPNSLGDWNHGDVALLNFDFESQNVFAPPFQIREGHF